MDEAELRELRRDLHRHPEPAWCEFYTTARLVETVRDIGVDALHVGPDVTDANARDGVPDDAELERWSARAREAGADPDLLDDLAGGHTGLVAEIRRGDGPTVALRVDIDGLPVVESEAADHRPASEGFRSTTGETMHACGHDAHATIGAGVLDAVAESDFRGTFRVIFQPAEEVIGGGRAVVAAGHVDDVDELLAVHVGLDYPTGEVVAGIEEFLAVSQFRAEFAGRSAHAGANPEAGRNAVLAMASAVQSLHALPRHADGATRVNAGRVGGGTATNVVPESAFVEGEFRGETTALQESMRERGERAIRGAASAQDCEVSVEETGSAPSARSDPSLAAVVARAARETPGVETVHDTGDLGGSEDATCLMARVQERGGRAAYAVVGTDHPGGHHTPTFDVDEASLDVGIGTLATAVLALGD